VRVLGKEGLSKAKTILGAKADGVRTCSVLNCDQRVKWGKWGLINGGIIDEGTLSVLRFIPSKAISYNILCDFIWTTLFHIH
jgi:hypothetical protein